MNHEENVVGLRDFSGFMLYSTVFVQNARKSDMC